MSVSYPPLSQEENPRPSAITSWKNAICLTAQRVTELLPSVNSIKKCGREYVRITTKYGVLLGLGAVFYANHRSPHPSSKSLLGILCLVALGHNIGTRFAPAILPTVLLWFAGSSLNNRISSKQSVNTVTKVRRPSNVRCRSTPVRVAVYSSC